MTGALASVATLPLVPGFRDEMASYLRSRDLRAYSLFTDPELFKGYWFREKVGEQVYKMRVKEKDILKIDLLGTNDVIDYKHGKVGEEIVFKYRSEMLEQNPIIPEGVNSNLRLYVLSHGILQPAVNSRIEVISTRSDVIHTQYDSPMVASFNATSPQALGMCEDIEIKNADRVIDLYEAPIIYGSSSIFIPSSISRNSPVWEHAEDRLTMSNPYFRELDFRKGDNSHNAIGFTKEGQIRLVTQAELINSIANRNIIPDLDFLTLNQFAFDPRGDKGIPETFTWTANIHRNVNMLLVTENDRQMVLSGSLDYFLRNEEYFGMIRQIEDQIGDRFKVVACLDVGLATGYTLRNNQNNVRKPVEPGFHDKDGNLSMGMLHTSAISLIQTEL